MRYIITLLLVILTLLVFFTRAPLEDNVDRNSINTEPQIIYEEM